MQTNRLTRPELLQFKPSPQALERLRVYQIVEAKERRRKSQYEAAKRALSIANKLKNPDSKKYHRSRIFGAMNRLRGGV